MLQAVLIIKSSHWRKFEMDVIMIWSTNSYKWDTCWIVYLCQGAQQVTWSCLLTLCSYSPCFVLFFLLFLVLVETFNYCVSSGSDIVILIGHTLGWFRWTVSSSVAPASSVLNQNLSCDVAVYSRDLSLSSLHHYTRLYFLNLQAITWLHSSDFIFRIVRTLQPHCRKRTITNDAATASRQCIPGSLSLLFVYILRINPNCKQCFTATIFSAYSLFNIFSRLDIWQDG